MKEYEITYNCGEISEKSSLLVISTLKELINVIKNGYKGSIIIKSHAGETSDKEMIEINIK